jgi:hypothetical protein
MAFGACSALCGGCVSLRQVSVSEDSDQVRILMLKVSCIIRLLPSLSLQAFKEGDVRFLICTDVAARGIDISGLPYVINMTLPDKSEDYIHRSAALSL